MEKLYGRSFPSRPTEMANSITQESYSWRNTEEFIEDKYPVDIRYNFNLDCKVTQNGFRPFLLKNYANRSLVNARLHFVATDINIPEPYKLKWKF
jgi:hypothetical protein